ncbi:7173_t:CDS:2 [Acaulospora morrowiae]|uniref:7173_t:CDS:1 n=1 Tax=Acaulospora morrowiae TaxID=94023 RepID=A0A9N9BJN2_9GLOM|nr:7173_t:CDS:2 [Acaulospora morrowiae]
MEEKGHSSESRRRKIFGTCKGCNQPNSNFNECKTCEEWISIQRLKLKELKYQIEERRSLISKQTCENCDQPKHIHHHIAACGECGYPELRVEDLYEFAIEEDEDKENDEEDGCGIKMSDLLCPRCDSRLQDFLQCPDYLEVMDRIRLELNEMNVDDPDYQKLLDVKQHYDMLIQQQEEDQWITEEEDNCGEGNDDWKQDYFLTKEQYYF